MGLASGPTLTSARRREESAASRSAEAGVGSAEAAGVVGREGAELPAGSAAELPAGSASEPAEVLSATGRSASEDVALNSAEGSIVLDGVMEAWNSCCKSASGLD